MSNSVEKNFPFSICLVHKLFEHRKETEKVDSCIHKTVRLAVAEAGFLFLDIVALVETVFWSSLAIVATIFHIFIPESQTEWIDQHIFKPIVDNASKTFRVFVVSISMTFIQFTSEQTIENCLNPIGHGLGFFVHKIVTPISNFHICSGIKE